MSSPKPLDWAIGIMATSKIGSEKIIPICTMLLKERYKALFYTVLPLHTSCQRNFFILPQYFRNTLYMVFTLKWFTVWTFPSVQFSMKKFSIIDLTCSCTWLRLSIPLEPSFVFSNIWGKFWRIFFSKILIIGFKPILETHLYL